MAVWGGVTVLEVRVVNLGLVGLMRSNRVRAGQEWGRGNLGGPAPKGLKGGGGLFD